MSSVKLTIVILVLIAATSIVGTLIPQGNEASTFMQHLNPISARLFMRFGLLDMYHSFWFRLLILALALNLFVCSVKRFPVSLALFRTRSKVDATPESKTRIEKDILPHIQPSDVASAGYELLRSNFRVVQKTEREPGVHILHAEKGRYSYFWVYLVHCSILMILLGAFIGSITGFEGYMTILEGETANTFTLKNSNVERALPFSVKLEKFSVSFYENGSPKEYRSDLSFMQNGQPAEPRKLLVNRPAKYKGISFYQSNYGSIPASRVQIAINRSSNAQPVYLEMRDGVDYILPGSDSKISLIDVQPDFMRIGPAVKLSIKPKDKDELQIWIFKNQRIIDQMYPGFFEQSPKFNPAAYKPYTFQLQNMETVFFTGLQVSKDPGVIFIWLGFSMLVAGLFLTFFVPFKRVWITINSSSSGATVTIAGRVSKNVLGLEKELEFYSTELEKFTS